MFFFSKVFVILDDHMSIGHLRFIFFADGSWNINLCSGNIVRPGRDADENQSAGNEQVMTATPNNEPFNMFVVFFYYFCRKIFFVLFVETLVLFTSPVTEYPLVTLIAHR